MTAVVPSPKTTLVILLGASRWPFSPEFQASKAFLNSAMELRAYFLNSSQFGLPQENLKNLFNYDKSSDDLDGEIGHFIEKRMAEMKQAGEPARDLLVYFVGHGGFVGNDSDFYLAIRRTRTDNPSASGLRMISLAYTLKEKARYLRRIVILDCCFAGAAFRAFQSGPAQTAILQTVDAFKVPGKGRGDPERGTSLLCSSRHTAPSLISQDGTHTMFSKALLDALSRGDPRRQDSLSLHAIADLTEDVLNMMPEKNVPRPEVHSPDQVDGDVADVPFFPNLAVKGTEASQILLSQTSQPSQSIPPLPNRPNPHLVPRSPVQTPILVPRSSTPRTSLRVRTALLIGLVLLVLAGIIGLFSVIRSHLITTSNGSPTATATSFPANGIGGIKAPDGESIGISDGTVAFDAARIDGSLKQQAAQKLAAGDTTGAQALWSEAASKDTSDAEALIYLEDQHVIASANPYITIVVGTMLTGDSGTVSVGRDNLQGAYVTQKEFNDGARLPNGVKVRLLIANSGSNTEYAKTVAQQIVQLAHRDPTVVGVMGWPYSSRALTAIAVLDAAHIPMVSQTAASDTLTDISPYFFRVAPPNKEQAIIGAKYAEQVLHASTIALFYDPADAYSQSLANAFSTQFTSDGNQIVATEKYTVGKPVNFPQLLSDAESHNPDLIYFSGYASDASVLLSDLPTSGPFANLRVMGGDALYELGGYQSSAHVNAGRMRFTFFAYPDEWQILCAQGQSFACSSPPFFADYIAYYDPNNQHTSGGSPYGFRRADGDTILSYDALLVMLTASSNALTGTKTSLTPADLLQALTKIQGAQAVQGVSGQISFDSKGNPFNKAIVVLKVAPGGFFQMDSVQGCFQVGHC
jgi:ABC-type branched-subunit amino acid transport system substrate-binding protein